MEIVSECQAIRLYKNNGQSGEVSGHILNSTKTMEYNRESRQLSVYFRTMKIKKIKRSEKKGSVMNEKFALLIHTQFKVGGGELDFHVWTLSLPIVVIVYPIQGPRAWATITWDNAFAEQVCNSIIQYQY